MVVVVETVVTLDTVVEIKVAVVTVVSGPRFLSATWLRRAR